MAGTALRREVVWEFDAQTAGMVSGLRNAGKALDGLREEANDADKALQGIGDVEVSVDYDREALAGLRRRLEAEKRKLQRDIGDINVDIDATKALAQLQTIERKIKSVDRMNADVDVDVDVDKDKIGDLDDAAGALSRMAQAAGNFAAGGPAVIGGLAAIGGVAASIVGPAGMGALAAAIGGAGTGGLLYLYDKWADGNTRIGDAFKRLRDEAKTTAKSVVGITGKIMEDLVMGLDVDKALSKALRGIESWVKDNQAQIENFFIAVGKAATLGAKLFITFADDVLPVVGQMIIDTLSGLGRLASGILRAMDKMMGAAAGILDTAAGAADLIPGMDGLADSLRNQADAARTAGDSARRYADDNDRFIDSVQEAWGSFARDVLPAIREGLDGASKQVDKWWKKLDRQGKDQTLQMRIAIEKGYKREVERTLDTLSKKRVAEILSKTDPNSDSKSERTLHQLAKQRLAEIRAEARNDNEVDRRLDGVAKDRTAKIGAEAGASVGTVLGKMLDLGKDRTAKIGADTGASVGTALGKMKELGTDRNATATVDIKTTGADLGKEIGKWVNKTFHTKVKIGVQAEVGVGAPVTRQLLRNVTPTPRAAGSTALAGSDPLRSPARTTPTVINVEVDGYRVARQVQRRFPASGRVYV